MEPEPRISVMVVTYESRPCIGACLDSLRDTAAPWIDGGFVVDNASRDGTAEWVREHHSWVSIIASDVNLGFGRAMNLAAKRASGEFLLIMNPDVVIHEGAVAELVRFLHFRPQAAACGPRIVDGEGRFSSDSRRGFPTPMSALGYFSGLDRLFPRSRSLGGYRLRWLPHDYEVIADALSGCCMMVRRTRFEDAGGFDEDYFLFGEDIDLCWKLRQNGGEVWYVPSATVTHAKGLSMRRSPHQASREFYRSMRLFIDKRLTSRYPRLLLSAMKLGMGLRSLCGKRFG